MRAVFRALVVSTRRRCVVIVAEVKEWLREKRSTTFPWLVLVQILVWLLCSLILLWG